MVRQALVDVFFDPIIGTLPVSGTASGEIALGPRAERGRTRVVAAVAAEIAACIIVFRCFAVALASATICAAAPITPLPVITAIAAPAAFPSAEALSAPFG